MFEEVRKNWHNAIPESAKMKHGKVVIEFAITKEGSVRGMKMVTSSGEKVSGLNIRDMDIDRAAWAGITASDPFPPLPSEFGGQYIALRIAFSYSPDKAEPK